MPSASPYRVACERPRMETLFHLRPPGTRLAPTLFSLLVLAACGAGEGSGDSPAAIASTAPTGAPMAASPSGGGPPLPTPTASAPPPVAPAPVVLPRPVLQFNDTGISVTDGLTFNGRWSVGSLLDGLGWEYSLDQGRTWIRGAGDSFEVAGDGPKLIWARTFDGLGNTSEIVMVSCTLDTMPPAQPQVSIITGGALPTIRIEGLEAMAGWEYSVDEQRSWIRGSGSSLTLAGNRVRTIWSRQVDAAGNPSTAVSTKLDDPASPGWIEVSGDPFTPTALPRWEGTLLLHGEISRPDMDFVRFDVPPGRRLRSLRLVHYDSPDPVAFYALQRAPVFDAGTDVQRMLSWKHLGPPDLLLELLSAIDPAARDAGPYTLWINQTGADLTAYAIEIGIGPE
jgi:hypothetical protein